VYCKVKLEEDDWAEFQLAADDRSTAAADGDRPPVNGEGHVMVNGVGDVHVPAPTRGGPPTRKDVQQQRQTAGTKYKQSALRRPTAAPRANPPPSRPGCPEQSRQRRVGKASDGVARSTLVNGGGQRQQPSGVPGRPRPPAAPDMKMFVTCRSASGDPHSPLQSAYGNRDFFGTTSSSRGAADPAVTELPHAGGGGTQDPGHGQSRSVLSNTHRHTQPFYCSSGTCPGLPER